MNVMRTFLAVVMSSVIAAAVAATPAAAQDSTSLRQERASRARSMARAQQQLQQQRQDAARARAEAQRQTQRTEVEARRQRQETARREAQQRAQANRQRLQEQRLKREQEQRQRQIQERLSWPEVTETVARTVRLGRGGTFDLQNVAGNIVITGGGGDEVRIEAVKRIRHRVETSARAMLPALRIDVLERAGHVEVRTEHLGRRDVLAAVDYTVAVPGGANVTLHTTSGDVHVSNVSGELRLQSVSGNLTAASVRRLREVRSTSGTLDIADAESDELTARTLSGDVIVRNLKGRVLDVQTVSGDVRLSGVEVDRARLQSTAGDVEYAGRLARSGRYEFQTHSGDVRISPSGNPGFTVEAATLSGDARSDFPLKAIAGAAPRPGESLHGTAGDGSAAVAAQSFSGDVLILRR